MIELCSLMRQRYIKQDYISVQGADDAAINCALFLSVIFCQKEGGHDVSDFFRFKIGYSGYKIHGK